MGTTKGAGARQKKRKIPDFKKRGPVLIFVAILLICLTALIMNRIAESGKPPRQIDNPKIERLAQVPIPSWIEADLLPKACDSRRGELLEDITGIVIHYVGNPNSTAQQNRNYFASAGTQVNSHFLVGLDGEVIQCLPLEEKSSATSERNRDTISIEVCHPDEEGRFSDASYDSLVRLIAWLRQVCELDEESVIRHYDVTGKECPIYYVKNEDAWIQLKADVAIALEELQAAS